MASKSDTRKSTKRKEVLLVKFWFERDGIGIAKATWEIVARPAHSCDPVFPDSSDRYDEI